MRWLIVIPCLAIIALLAKIHRDNKKYDKAWQEMLDRLYGGHGND